MYSKVMIIDDNDIDLIIGKRVISNLKFASEVITLSSAKEAFQYLQTSDKDLPEIIFLDINMPEINGFDFLDLYAQLPERIIAACKIVMLTTSLHPGEKRRANDHPLVKYFLNKPLNQEKLAELTDALRGKQ